MQNFARGKRYKVLLYDFKASEYSEFSKVCFYLLMAQHKNSNQRAIMDISRALLALGLGLLEGSLLTVQKDSKSPTPLKFDDINFLERA